LALLQQGRFVLVDQAPRDPVLSINSDHQNRIIVAAENGVYLGENGGYRPVLQNGNPIRSVNVLYRDPDGVVWMGLNGGGLRILDKGKVTSIQTRDGLYDGEIYGIARDSQDQLWMACSRGVFSVSRAQLRSFAAGDTKKVDSSPYSPTDAQRVIE